jgi:acyl-CoA synthetase (AMP-forming)/AMP-acid ligase II
MNIAELLSQHAIAAPDRNALVDLSGLTPRTLTYGQLERAVSSAASAFSKGGLSPGARVAVLHPINAALYVAIGGLLRAGLVPVICDPGARHDQRNRAFEIVSPEGIFASPAGQIYAMAFPALASARHRFTAGAFPGTTDITAVQPGSAIVPRVGEDAALITFTSGSTGLPKAVVRTHALLRAQFEAIRGMVPLTGVDLATMPIALLANLASGVTSVISGVDLRRPGKADPRRLVRDIERTHATSIVASPAMLDGLAHADSARLRSLRRIITGGGPAMPSLMNALQNMLHDVEIIGVYGSSEAEPIACLSWSSISDPDLQAMRDGAGLLVGTPVADAEVRIRDGEIVVAGRHVVPGYLNGVGDGEAKIPLDGRTWHRTGDGGYVDARGRLWLTGRVQAIVRDDRGAIEPLRVECSASFEPEVKRSALFGIGNRRVLAVEPRAGMRIDLERLERRLAWARIDKVSVVHQLPVERRHNAKIDYPALRRRVHA